MPLEDKIGDAIGWTVSAPFKLAYRAVKVASQAKELETLATTAAARDEARKQVRAKQLADLAAAAPQGPADRMRATIHLNEYKVPWHEPKKVHHLLGKPSYDYMEVEEHTRYSVDMILQLSETDRAIIRQHRLEEVILDEEPLYTELQTAKSAVENADAIEREDDLLMREILKDGAQRSKEEHRTAKRVTKVGDLLLFRYTREFERPFTAKEYSDKLKTSLLPKLKQLIDRYRNHKQAETLEF